MIDTLRPGFPVTRRDGATLQVGLDRRAVVPDTPQSRAVLKGLATGYAVADLPGATEVLETLAAHDLLVDHAALGRGPAATYATHGPDAPRRLQARAQASVAVHVVGGEEVVASLAAEARDVAAAGGLRPTDPEPRSTVALLVCAGEPDRDVVDRLVAAGQPHLLVTFHEGASRIGPFVVPGVTACLRCVDAHLDHRDGRRGVVLCQLAGEPSPVDPVAARAALALAVRDLVAYVDGDRPATWSATQVLGERPGLEQHEWRRHPHCGCCWGDLFGLTEALA